MKFRSRLDLQAKIIIVLIAVIVPTFLLVTIAENKLTQPILAEEMKQVGITSAKNLAAEIVSEHLLSGKDNTSLIEARLQEFLYSQPNLVRIDVVIRDPSTGSSKIIASTVEEEPGVAPQSFPLVEKVIAEHRRDEEDADYWEISVPIEQRSRDLKIVKKNLGSVHLTVSLKFVQHTVNAVWRITGTAAVFSVILIIIAMSYFLRKTIANDRRLRQAEDENIQLTSQLHDLERQVMNTEKLAVMGQLTASFAHEIGTPLNAIGGHLQLLQEELKEYDSRERLAVINGQVSKIENIVKNFLQSTSKPISQRQLVDINRLVEQSLFIVRPRTQSLEVEVQKTLNRELGPLRAVPLELEQVLLNLLNNSLDSLKAKIDASKAAGRQDKTKLRIEVVTDLEQAYGKEWVVVSLFDTGEGISKADLPKVLKPFFTTKRPGEGTGLGLTICDQLLKKYGGTLEIDSKEGAWTKATIRMPFQVTL